MKFPVQNKILLGFIVSVIALALASWISLRATTRLTAMLDLATHSQEVITKVEAGLAALASVETEQRCGLAPVLVGGHDMRQQTETDRRIKADDLIEKLFTVEHWCWTYTVCYESSHAKEVFYAHDHVKDFRTVPHRLLRNLDIIKEHDAEQNEHFRSQVDLC